MHKTFFTSLTWKFEPNDHLRWLCKIWYSQNFFHFGIHKISLKSEKTFKNQNIQNPDNFVLILNCFKLNGNYLSGNQIAGLPDFRSHWDPDFLKTDPFWPFKILTNTYFRSPVYRNSSVLDPMGIQILTVSYFVCRPPAYAASYEEINDFLGKGHYKKLYQETNSLKIFWLVTLNSLESVIS